MMKELLLGDDKDLWRISDLPGSLAVLVSLFILFLGVGY